MQVGPTFGDGIRVQWVSEERFLNVIRTLLLAIFLSQPLLADSRGYFRFPAIHGDTIVFAAQGDLFKVGVGGGTAAALTTHPGQETNPAISRDGKLVAFTATYEGPAEVYVMPIEGGLPTRLTYEGASAVVVGWTRDGKVLYRTNVYTTLPDQRLYAVDPESKTRTPIPLNQASDGDYDDSGRTLFLHPTPVSGRVTPDDIRAARHRTCGSFPTAQLRQRH